MKKQKILFVINQFFKGGAETALLNLFGILDPSRYDVDFLVLDDLHLKGTVSLLPQVPDWVHVVNVAQGEGLFAFLKKLFFKLFRAVTHRQLFRRAAVRYVRKHRYDAAISFGEWFSPALVAREVSARRKYVWIHADLDKAAFVHPDLLSCHQHFDGFLFVSAPSMAAAVGQYPALAGRTALVYNVVDKAALLEKSRLPMPISLPGDGLPVLLTVANIRPEKNHLRQVRVMQQLKEQGLLFHWINIGSLSNLEAVHQLKNAIADAGLQGYFHLTGAIENPYPVMKAADAVCVLSDHESWSMVITEAKTLGVPVIATKTSGALAQLVPGETGLLCDFCEEAMAQTIKELLSAPQLQAKIRSNLSTFAAAEQTLQQLEPLLTKQEEKILFVFDDIGYRSGARNAALQQAAALKDAAEVTLFSAEPCKDDALRRAYRIVDLENNVAFRCLSMPLRQVLTDPKVGKKAKLLRCIYAVAARLSLDNAVYAAVLRREVRSFMESFHAVCVVSEASKLRWLVSRLKHPRKIQWIHTDYAAWRQQSSWTRAITRKDGKLYSRYHAIVCLSRQLKENFDRCHPSLRQKTEAIGNLIACEDILSKAAAPCEISVDSQKTNLITVGRMEQEKRFDRILAAAALLKKQGTPFHWYLVGSGSRLEEVAAQCRAMGLDDAITLTGAMEDPYPLMAQCDLFVLLSDYEGTPVTIDEAKVLGLPVFAAAVGGIADMLEDGKYGTACPDTDALAPLLAQQCRAPKQPCPPFSADAHNDLVKKQLFSVFFDAAI